MALHFVFALRSPNQLTNAYPHGNLLGSQPISRRKETLTSPIANETRISGTMQPRKYPTLLPATTWPVKDESSSSNTQSPSKEEPKKGGNGKPVACNECRRRKTKVLFYYPNIFIILLCSAQNLLCPMNRLASLPTISPT